MSDQYFRFLTRDASRSRSVLLEQLLARADDWVSVADWRADAFRVIDRAASALHAGGRGGRAVRRSWCRGCSLGLRGNPRSLCC